MGFLDARAREHAGAQSAPLPHGHEFDIKDAFGCKYTKLTRGLQRHRE
jgi:hypothetical protein